MSVGRSPSRKVRNLLVPLPYSRRTVIRKSQISCFTYKILRFAQNDMGFLTQTLPIINVPLSPDRRFDLHWALPRLDHCDTGLRWRLIYIRKSSNSHDTYGFVSRASAPGLPADRSAVMLYKHALTAVLLWLRHLYRLQVFCFFITPAALVSVFAFTCLVIFQQL